MGLVYNINFVCVSNGCLAHIFFDISNLVYAAVGGGVNFYNIQGVVRIYFFAGIAFITRLAELAELRVFGSFFTV